MNNTELCKTVQKLESIEKGSFGGYYLSEDQESIIINITEPMNNKAELLSIKSAKERFAMKLFLSVSLAILLVFSHANAEVLKATYVEDYDAFYYGEYYSGINLYPFEIAGQAIIWPDQAAVYADSILDGNKKPLILCILSKGDMVKVAGFVNGMVKIETQEKQQGYVDLSVLMFDGQTHGYRKVIADTWCILSPQSSIVGDESAGCIRINQGTDIKVVGIYGDYMYLVQLNSFDSIVGYVQSVLCMPVESASPSPEMVSVQVLQEQETPLYQYASTESEIITWIPAGEKVGVGIKEIDNDYIFIKYWYDDFSDYTSIKGYIKRDAVTFFITD